VKIAELRALLAKATPGEWSFEAVNEEKDPFAGTYRITSDSGAIMGDPDYYNYAPETDDARLIAAMKNALPALLRAADVVNMIIAHRLDIARTALRDDAGVYYDGFEVHNSDGIHACGTDLATAVLEACAKGGK